MTGWIRSNLRSGALQRLSLPGVPLVLKERTLDIVPGLAPVSASFSCVPKAAIAKLVPRMQTGDFIFFASIRKHLDVFHCGIVVRNGSKVLVRHASRSCGVVVEQDLKDFLKANRMAGVLVARARPLH
jgi:hypothetical protein